MRSNGTGWGGTTVVVAAAISAGTAAAATPERDDPDAGFSAEVTVTHTMVDAKGVRLRDLPTARYRLDRGADGVLRLTMLATRSSPARGPLADPIAGITVDTAADGAWRVRGASGQALNGPAAAASLPLAEADGDSLVVRGRDRGRRLAALARRYGRATGTVRALSRYLERRGRTVEEVLVAPETGLPAELNRVENGVLLEQHRFEYTPAGDDRFVRSRTESTSAVPDGSGTRVVSVTTLSAIQITGGAR